MKKFLGLLLGVLFVFGVVGSAWATSIDVKLGDDSYVSLDVLAIGGLSAELNSNLGSLDETITDGDTWEIDFFTLTATSIWSGMSVGIYAIEA